VFYINIYRVFYIVCILHVHLFYMSVCCVFHINTYINIWTPLKVYAMHNTHYIHIWCVFYMRMYSIWTCILHKHMVCILHSVYPTWECVLHQHMVCILHKQMVCTLYSVYPTWECILHKHMVYILHNYIHKFEDTFLNVSDVQETICTHLLDEHVFYINIWYIFYIVCIPLESVLLI